MAPVRKLLVLLQSSLSDELVLLICGFGIDFSVSAPLSVTCTHYYQLLKPELALNLFNTEELQLVVPSLSQLVDFKNAPENFCYGIAYKWGVICDLAECAVTTPACHGQYFRIREEDRIDSCQPLSWPELWAPFDEDGLYCEYKTDRMMSEHSLDMIIYPQHACLGPSGRPGVPKYIIITLLKEAITALRGTALATAKQQLAHLMETSASQQKMPVPVHSDTVVNEVKYYIMLQSLQQKPGWTNTACISQQTAQSRYTALCSTELFRRICSTQSTVAWNFDQWFSNAPAHVDETTYFGLYTTCYLGESDYTIGHDCYTCTLMQVASSIFGD